MSYLEQSNSQRKKQGGCQVHSGGRKAEELLKKKRESGLQMCSGAAQKSGFVSGEKTQFLLKCTGRQFLNCKALNGIL